MKHLIILIVFFILPILTFSQSLKSNFLVSTNFSYKKDNTEIIGGTSTANYFQKTITLQPKIGYFIINRICVGVYSPYNKIISKIASGIILRDKSYGVGPFVKYYQPLNKKLFGVVNLGFHGLINTDQYYDINTEEIYESKSKIKLLSSDKNKMRRKYLVQPPFL